MNLAQVQVVEVPAWVKSGPTDVLSLYEAACLMGIEGQWVRMSSADQRALMGGAPFGRQAFKIDEDGTLTVIRSSCFGQDCEQAEYSAAKIGRAVAVGLKLSPGTFGPSYLN